MHTTEILIAIDEEILKLQQARELLTGNAEVGKRAGRLPGAITSGAKSTRRTMSEEGRARIAAAQRKRWAAQKKASRSAKPIATKSA